MLRNLAERRKATVSCTLPAETLGTATLGGDEVARGIVEAASVHLIASIPNGFILEYCVADTPIRKEMTEEIRIVNGYAELPQKPGLGIEIDEKAIKKYSSNY